MEFEVIIVDDHSSDNILELITNKYVIKYIRNKNNLGASESRNIGVMAAKYQFIAFLDSDDIWLSDDKLFQQFNILKNNNDISIVYTNLQYINENGEIIFTHTPIKNKNKYSIISLPDILKKDVIGTYSSVMVRKNDIMKCGMCNTSLQARQDWDLWIRLAQVGNAYKLNNIYVQYRKHIFQISSNYKNKIQGFSQLLINHKDIFYLHHKYFHFYYNIFKVLLLTKLTYGNYRPIDLLLNKNRYSTIIIRSLISILIFISSIPILGMYVKNKLSNTYLIGDSMDILNQ